MPKAPGKIEKKKPTKNDHFLFLSFLSFHLLFSVPFFLFSIFSLVAPPNQMEPPAHDKLKHSGSAQHVLPHELLLQRQSRELIEQGEKKKEQKFIVFFVFSSF